MASHTSEEAFESSYVHEVYEEIAPHFSSTRYKVCEVCFHGLTVHGPFELMKVCEIAMANRREVFARFARWLCGS